MKIKVKKYKLFLAVCILYVLAMLMLPLYTRDVVLSMELQEEPEGYSLAQIFYDNGNGYNAEDAVDALITGNAVSLVLPKDIVKGINTIRLDPIDHETELVITGIWINENEVDLQKFTTYLTEQVQTEVSYNENEHSITMNVEGNDPQLYLNSSFTKLLKRGSRSTWKSRMPYLIGGIVLFWIIFYWENLLCVVRKSAELCERFCSSFFKNQRRMILLGCGIIVLAAVIVMHLYLLGSKTFVFEDAGDSVTQDYPKLLQLAENISEGTPQNTYSFSNALGGGLGYVKLNLSNWVAYFGTDALPYLLGVSQTLKIIASGLFFFLFLKVKGIDIWYSTILALGYAFCGHMVIRSSWQNYPNEVVLVALGLFCIELLLKRRDWRWILPMVFLFVYHFPLGGYYSVAYMALTTGYLIFRIATEYRINWKYVGIAAGIALVAGGLFLWVTDFRFVNLIMMNLASDRAQENIQMIQNVWNGSEEFSVEFGLLPRILSRTVGLAVIGIIGCNYTGGYINFLEDPVFYCGIFVLLLVPVAFYSMNRKQRIWYGVVYLAAAAICLLPQLRTIANGFAGGTFKLFTFWIMIFLLYTAAQVDWEMVTSEKGRRMASILCVITAVFWIAVLCGMPYYIECVQAEVLKCLAFCILECLVILWVINRKHTGTASRTVFVLLACTEVVMISYPVYADRNTADGDVYEDGTENVLAWIRETEGDTFYRVDKQYTTVGDCDSIAQGFNGTAYYVGGTGLDAYATKFYDDLGLPGTVSNNKMAYGTTMQNELETVLGFQYALSQNTAITNYGYQEVYEEGGIHVFENEYAVPFGFVYEKAIERSTFEQLDMNQRQQVLLYACLVEDGESAIPLITQDELDELNNKERLFDEYEISYESTADDPFYYDGNPEQDSFTITPNSDEELIALQLTFNHAAKGYIYYSTQDGEIFNFVIEQETESTGQIYEINVSNVDKIWWVSPSWSNITSLRIAKIPKEQYYQYYVKQANEINERAVQIVSYSDNEIQATVNSSVDGMLYLPVVDGEWYVYLDGEAQTVQKINDTFIGLYVNSGEHAIRIKHPTGTWWDVYQSDLEKLVVIAVIIAAGTICMHYKKKRRIEETT